MVVEWKARNRCMPALPRNAWELGVTSRAMTQRFRFHCSNALTWTIACANLFSYHHHSPCTMHALRLILRRRNIPASSGVQRPRRLYSTSTRTCPSCSAPLRSPLPTCLRCSYIQPLPSELTYYDILGVSNTSQNLFKVDVRDLKKKFLEAQRVCHPDAWSGKGEVCYEFYIFQKTEPYLHAERAELCSLPIIRDKRSLQDIVISFAESAIHTHSTRYPTPRNR